MDIDKAQLQIERKLQLFRGWIAQKRGVHAGLRFGLGHRVMIAYPSYLHVGNDVSILDNAFLHCLAERGVRIGNRTSIDRNLWLHCGGTSEDNGHGFFEIGDDSYIGCNAVMGSGGGIHIGSMVLIGQSVNIHAENHNFADPDTNIREQGVSYQGIVIEHNVWIGSKVTILDGVTIGTGTIVGAGTVVTKSVPSNSIVVGNPGKVIGTRKPSKNRDE